MTIVQHTYYDFKQEATPSLLASALKYAQSGVYIFPLHSPVFDDAGDCIGCTCEGWKRKQARYGADYKCDQPGKCPRIKWAEKSTTDEERIREWWGWSPNANIGIDCGKSGLIVLDRDTYKDSYAGDPLHIEARTVTIQTGSGGQHIYFRMPEGKSYGNATGNLPKGNDVRGVGGYVVAAPSLHKSGRRYEYAPGLSFNDLQPALLPQSLIDVLDAAQSAHVAPVIFTDETIPMPHLARWNLSPDILNLIDNGAPKGERSEADFRVLLALVAAGATDDDIRATFTHFAIGDKYSEKGDKYLAHSIAKARAIAIERPHAAKELFETALRNIRSPQFVEILRDGGIKRVALPIACLHSLLTVAMPRRTMKIAITMRELGDMYSVSAMAASRHIKQLEVADAITVDKTGSCTVIDLSKGVDQSVTVQESVNYCNALINPTDEAFYGEHRGDDAFTSYPYSYAIKRRECPTVLMQSLGANGLLLWAALAKGGTVKELAEETGLTVASVRYTLKRFKQADLLQSVQECGRATEYWLCSYAEELLEEIRPEMVTAGKGQLIAGRNASDTASFARRTLRMDAQIEPRKRAWLENRQEKCDAKAMAIYASLESMGINPYAKVAHRTPRPNTIRFDDVEEWRSWGKRIWETLQRFGDIDLSEKLRMMTVAHVGEDASYITYRNARKEIAERVERTLTLAPRRASLERAYTHPDVEEDTPLVPVTTTTLFAMPQVYA
jgi:putative DNA primase/helicase